MSRNWQIYYSSILGAIGGLVAWLLIGMVATTVWSIHLANIFVGAGIGLFIGGALGASEGMMVKRSVSRSFIGLLKGSLTGVVSGALGLLLGGAAFLLVQGGLIARMAGWMALGLLLGLGQGAMTRNSKRAIYGLVGGTLAGLAGGAMYELVTQAYLSKSGVVQVYLSAAGIILIGTCLGSIIPLSERWIAERRDERGLVVVLTGKRANMEVVVIDRATLGSSDAADVYLPDKAIEKKQAEIRKSPHGFVIQNIGSSRPFAVNRDVLVQPGATTALADDAVVFFGETQLQFRAS